MSITRDIAERAIARWGDEAQLRQLQEECAELIVAVNHYLRRRASLTDLAAEVADVEIMLEQARAIIGDIPVDSFVAGKTNRLRGHLEDQG